METCFLAGLLLGLPRLWESLGDWREHVWFQIAEAERNSWIRCDQHLLSYINIRMSWCCFHGWLFLWSAINIFCSGKTLEKDLCLKMLYFNVQWNSVRTLKTCRCFVLCFILPNTTSVLSVRCMFLQPLKIFHVPEETLTGRLPTSGKNLRGAP